MVAQLHINEEVCIFHDFLLFCPSLVLPPDVF